MRGSAHPKNPYKPKQIHAGGNNAQPDQKLYMSLASRRENKPLNPDFCER
jgi:hypothetical protein